MNVSRGPSEGRVSESDRALVEELLQISEADIDGATETRVPRRNTKQDIISQVWKLRDEAKVQMDHSETALRRMSKSQLAELLASMMETASRDALAKSLGAVNADPSSITLAALRMMWDTCVGGLEKGSSCVLPSMGYSLDGLLKNSQSEPTSDVINQCLREIAIDNPQILAQIASPYARLGMCMFTVCITTVHTVDPQLEYLDTIKEI